MQISIGNYTAARSIVDEPKLESTCGHCGSPITVGDWRWIEIGVETFAVGCSAECCFEAAIAITELFEDTRAAQKAGNQ